MPPNIRKNLTNCEEMKERGNSKISKASKKCILTEVREKKMGSVNPVIVTFQNGNLNEKQASDFDVTLTASENGETNVEIKTPYGHVFKDSLINKLQSKQFIAIRNRKTNKVKLVEVDNAVLINSVLLNTPVMNTSSSDYGKEIKTLKRTFGGKKIAVRLEQNERLNLSSLPIADEVKKAVEDIEVDESFSLKSIEVESMMHLLPPCHRNAEILSDVYKISEILSEDELQSLQEKVNELEMSEFNPQEYSAFFGHCYTEAKNSKEGLDIRLAGILFIECLIKFLKIQSKRLASKTIVLCPFSSVIHEKLLNEFCIKTDISVTRPLTMRDKSLCYIIALGLICCGYQVNLKILSTTTAVHLNRLTRLARVVGAVPRTKEDHIYVLKLPLPALPKLSKGKVQKK